MSENAIGKKIGRNSIILRYFTDFEDKSFRVKSFFTVLVFFASCLTFAQFLFPAGYSINEYYISEQGSTTQNPVGSWFFIIGASLTGLLLIPHFLYLHKRLMPALPPLTYLMSFCGLVGCVGFVLVGSFPENIPEIVIVHDWGANLAFGGFGFAAFLSLWINGYRAFNKKYNKPSLKAYFMLYAAVILVGIGLVINTSTTQQWFGLFTVLTWMIGITLVV